MWKMNFCVRRLIHINLISHFKVSAFKRGMLTCHAQGGVKNRSLQFLALQDKYIGCMNIPEKFIDLSINNCSIRNSITDPMVVPKGEIGIPISAIICELPTINNTNFIEPVDNVFEKKAENMFRIRRRKMKKHKWKKRQRKMKIALETLKLKKRRKAFIRFEKEVSTIIDSGEKYNPEVELKEKLEMLRWEKPINRVRGAFCPKWVVDEYLEAEKKKKMITERISICLNKIK